MLLSTENSKIYNFNVNVDTKLTKWNMVQLKQIMTSSGISKWSQKKTFVSINYEKKSLNSDCQQFHLYQQNEQSPLTLTH